MREEDQHTPLAAALVGVGYLLLIAWFLLLGIRLLGWNGGRDRQDRG